MTTIKDPKLEKIIERLKQEFQPLKIYLFGSRARGEQTADSDYDLVVVVKDSLLTPLQRMHLGQMAMWSLNIKADVFVYTSTEFEEYLNQYMSIPYNAKNEGIELSV